MSVALIRPMNMNMTYFIMNMFMGMRQIDDFKMFMQMMHIIMNVQMGMYYWFMTVQMKVSAAIYQQP